MLAAILLTVFTISAIVLSGHTEWAFAVDDNVTIIVNISEVSSIEVTPTGLTWNATTPGTDAGNKTLDVKNIGSNNLTNIWASVNITGIEEENPLGQDSTYYASGGLIAMANDTNLTYWFAGRLEWNISYTPSGFSLSTYSAGNRSWGWFRNAGEEYLWEIIANASASGGMCNNSGTGMNISSTADTGSGD